MFTLLIPILVFSFAYANTDKFPENFIFGVSTSSYQIEGAWNESGKGENIIDFITHLYPPLIADQSNGDIACDSYHKLDEDVRMLKELGVNFYRFSISWSRIAPTGDVSKGISLDGIYYYKNMLKKLADNGIDAMVTILHFDIPKDIVFRKFLLDESMNQVFVDYARLLFMLFGDQVKYWSTFNEPRQICVDAMEMVSPNPGVDSYTCIHNVIKCHAKVYRLYEREFKEDYGGQMSIVLNTNWNEPKSQSESDVEAAERALLFYFGCFAHPLVFGDYPDVVKKRVRIFSSPFSKSRLPEFSAEESEMVKGTLDFIGLNHYTTNYAEDNSKHSRSFIRTFTKDIGITLSYDPSWEQSTLEWLYVVPFGMRKILNWINSTYEGVPIFITENGFADDGSLQDDRRINYYKTYLGSVLEAIHIDQVNVLGYATWSLMDNWEWTSGYTQKFGLFYVNFTSPDRERISKNSVQLFKRIVQTRCLPED